MTTVRSPLHPAQATVPQAIHPAQWLLSGSGAAPSGTLKAGAPPLSAAQLEHVADRVLAARDDAAKQRALVQELARLDSNSGARLMALLTRRLHTEQFMGPAWFSARAFDKAVTDRVLTRAQAGLVAEAFATAYDNGICRSANGCYMDPSSAIGSVAAAAFLDTGHVSYVDDIAAVNRFLRSGSASVMEPFLRDYVGSELRLMADNMSWQGMFSVMRVETLMHLLAGAGTAALTVEVFAGLSPQQRAGVYTLMRGSSFGTDATAAGGQKLISGWAVSDDPLAILMQAVGDTRGLGGEIRVPGAYGPVGREARVTPADQLAVELVQWASKHQDAFWWGSKSVPDRAAAMARLVGSRLPHLLDTLTTPTTGTDNSSGRALPANLAQVDALAQALRLTMLNDAVPAAQRTAIQQGLFDYIGQQTRRFDPDRRGEWNPMERVGLVLAAVQLGVSQGWRSAEDRRASQEQVVGFFTDLLIDQASAAASGKLSPAGKLAEIVGGQVIDAATKAGKEALRQALTDFLFGKVNNAGLDSLQSRINALTDAYVEQLPAALQTPVVVALDRIREASNSARR